MTREHRWFSFAIVFSLLLHIAVLGLAQLNQAQPVSRLIEVSFVQTQALPKPTPKKPPTTRVTTPKTKRPTARAIAPEPQISPRDFQLEPTPIPTPRREIAAPTFAPLKLPQKLVRTSVEPTPPPIPIAAPDPTTAPTFAPVAPNLHNSPVENLNQNAPISPENPDPDPNPNTPQTPKPEAAPDEFKGENPGADKSGNAGGSSGSQSGGSSGGQTASGEAGTNGAGETDKGDEKAGEPGDPNPVVDGNGDSSGKGSGESKGDGAGKGEGNAVGDGTGDKTGDGNGDGKGSGDSKGDGNGNGEGDGSGDGQGDGDGKGGNGNGNRGGNGGGANGGGGLPFGLGKDGGGSGPRHIVYVLDISWSMMPRIDIAKAQLRDALKTLQPAESFAIIALYKKSLVFKDQLLAPTSANIAQSHKFLNRFDDKHLKDGTNVEAAIESALKMRGVNVVVLITDGVPNYGETDFDKLAARVRTLNKQKARIFTVGLVGKNPDGSDDSFLATRLLENIAKQNSGEFKLVNTD